MKRREFIAFLGGGAAAALPLTASAQQSVPPSRPAEKIFAFGPIGGETAAGGIFLDPVDGRRQ